MPIGASTWCWCTRPTMTALRRHPLRSGCRAGGGSCSESEGRAKGVRLHFGSSAASGSCTGTAVLSLAQAMRLSPCWLCSPRHTATYQSLMLRAGICWLSSAQKHSAVLCSRTQGTLAVWMAAPSVHSLKAARSACMTCKALWCRLALDVGHLRNLTPPLCAVCVHICCLQKHHLDVQRPSAARMAQG